MFATPPLPGAATNSEGEKTNVLVMCDPQKKAYTVKMRITYQT